MVQGRDDDDGAGRGRKPRRVNNREQAPKPAAKRNPGRVKKGEVRNPWGPLGNPAKRAARAAAKDESLLSLLTREAGQMVTVREGGRKVTMSCRELFVKKLFRDLLDGPPKVRLAVLDRRSIFREALEHSEQEEEEVWTAELEEEFRFVAGLYNLSDFNETDHREELAFRAWSSEQRRHRGTDFDKIPWEERMCEYLREGRDREDDRDQTEDDRDLRHGMLGG